MVTRYVTYFLQFAASFLIAIKLGPEALGKWSFILLIINFFNIVDFGIANSANVLLVQNRDDKLKREQYLTAATVITTGMVLVVIFIYLITLFFDIELLDKYNANEFLPVALLVIVCAYYNKLFAAVYRVKNALFEVAFYQSVVPALLFFVIIVFDNNLLWLLAGAYMVGGVASLCMFLSRGKMAFSKTIDWKIIHNTLSKGFWLFLYNSAFYLIMYASSLSVSIYYEVGEYGKFHFAYTLAHAFILLIDAFGYIIFPKMIDRLKDNDYSHCISVIDTIRSNYLPLVYGLVFLGMPLYFFFCQFMPQYSDTSQAFFYSALALLPYANCFGINTYLIAQNEERLLSSISIMSLLLNLIFLVLLIGLFHAPYSVIYVGVMITYSVYTFSCTYLLMRKRSKKVSIIKVFQYAFPIQFSLPFILALILVSALGNSVGILYLFLPILLFIIINHKSIIAVFNTIKVMIQRPTIVDL